MRPHSLEVTAFGAFAGTVRVDFDELAAGGLFLLHGETGAGKTTLLDAVGFALYGRVPGERGAAKRLRSDHAAATERTSVCLEATISGRRLRITRTPEQARAKKRGTGTTTEQASVLLEQWDGAAWVPLSTRVGEADQEILDRVGMSAEQFHQVILLPQGEFAKFLRAPSEQRADLLERLFGTERFRDVEAWLGGATPPHQRRTGPPPRRDPQRRGARGPDRGGRATRRCPRPRVGHRPRRPARGRRGDRGQGAAGSQEGSRRRAQLSRGHPRPGRPATAPPRGARRAGGADEVRRIGHRPRRGGSTTPPGPRRSRRLSGSPPTRPGSSSALSGTRSQPWSSRRRLPSPRPRRRHCARPPRNS